MSPDKTNNGWPVWIVPDHHHHDPGPQMPEQPGRIDACLEAMEGISSAISFQQAPKATEEMLLRAHDESYLGELREFCQRGGGHLDADTPAGPDSFRIARLAAGACAGAAERAFETGSPAWCLVRPPGHHATRNRAMGFCLLNNVAVAAAHLLAQSAEKVAIVDLDVHHGNGTQEIFWEDPRVLYVSLHQWPWYPNYTGALDEIGGSEGKGFNVNVPLPAGSGDSVYIPAISRLVVPIISEFRPDALLISAGFDAHARDPLSLMDVSTKGYRGMFTLLSEAASEICRSRMVVVLEGGYDLPALGESWAASLKAMLEPVSPADFEMPATLTPAMQFHRKIWTTLD